MYLWYLILKFLPATSLVLHCDFSKLLYCYHMFVSHASARSLPPYDYLISLFDFYTIYLTFYFFLQLPDPACSSCFFFLSYLLFIFKHSSGDFFFSFETPLKTISWWSSRDKGSMWILEDAMTIILRVKRDGCETLFKMPLTWGSFIFAFPYIYLLIWNGQGNKILWRYKEVGIRIILFYFSCGFSLVYRFRAW